MIELKTDTPLYPCPFCGNDDVILTKFPKVSCYYVTCLNCNTEGPRIYRKKSTAKEDKDEACRLWNVRKKRGLEAWLPEEGASAIKYGLNRKSKR